MKKILTLLVAIFTFVAFAQAQTQAITVQGGYSWTMGMAGIAYQYNFLEVGAGVMPSTMPGSGAAITSFSAYLAWTDYKPYESGFYLSLGFASKGYRSQYSYNGGSWTDDFTAPLGIVNLGYKWRLWSGLNLKGEVGYGFCEYANVVTYGFTAGWTLPLN